MIHYVAYFLIALAATSAGAMTGMGGGVIIKPVLDMLKDFDVASISLLSSITVFAMAIVSVYKQIRQKAPIQYAIAVQLALGSTAGGIIGDKCLSAIIGWLKANDAVLVVQNILLALLIIAVFFYMINKDKIKSLGVTRRLWVILVGLLLGLISSFLGIGGGPINVALLIYVFSFDIKMATICSIITILFAQIAKLLSVILSSNRPVYDLSMVFPMVAGAVLGGLLGSRFNRKLPAKTVEICFNCVQIIVFLICLFNIVKNIAPIMAL